MKKEPLPPFWTSLRENWQTQPLGPLIWKYLRNWWLDIPEDPWSPEIAEAVRKDDAVMVCHHCLEPYEEPPDFCPKCGAAIGPYNNVKPFERIFSIGEVLRNGVRPDAKRSFLTVTGYVLMVPILYGLLAPVYLLRILWNFCRRNSSRVPETDTPDEET